jgi:hypothetical protein
MAPFGAINMKVKTTKKRKIKILLNILRILKAQSGGSARLCSYLKELGT